MKNIIVGMSGGVDSAVAAYLLVKKGYNVEGIFMKNWEDDSEYCTSEADYLDALQVCDKIDIPLRTVNFSKQYWNRVFKYFLDEYKSGRTPNPDIMCNTEIKFKEFLDYAINLGADKIATGHYVQIKRDENKFKLLKGSDPNKDQSYFLYGLKQSQIKKVIFPVGNLKKSVVREYAEKLGFNNSKKKDSTGICFIGKRNFKSFLKEYLPEQPGEIITLDGEIIGQHDGLMYYTLGQRKGLGVGGASDKKGSPWYVIEKDLNKNRLIVGQGNDNKKLYKISLTASKINWISGNATKLKNCYAKIRYRMDDAPCIIKKITPNSIKVEFLEPQFAIAPGQSIVFYNKDECLGGGVIDKSIN